MLPPPPPPPASASTSCINNNNNNNNNNNSHSQNKSMLLLISSTNSSNHQFPLQNHKLIDDEKQSINSSSSSSSSLMNMMPSPPILMEKSNQQQQQLQQNQQSLKCPRCDSSNTKFCYYNNYSLSQPRHFCKACKRYWTRGGTLRNVPVGGGCRKNKRVKKPSSISALDSPNSSSNPTTLLQSSSPNPTINPPLFYGMPTTSADPSTHLNLPSYPNFNSRVSLSGFDGLGFSSGFMDYPNPTGFNPKEIQEAVNSNSLLSRFPMFGSSNIQQQQQQQQHKFMGLLPYEDMQMMGGNSNNGDGNMVNKDVKMEDSQNRLNWSSATQMDQMGSSDQSDLWSTPGGVGSWLDPTNIGSSVPSLI